MTPTTPHRLGLALVLTAIGCSIAGLGVPTPVRAQQPMRNLQYFPQDIARDSLIEVMRGFSFALGVRCQYCHIGGDGVSFEGVDFASDEDPDKRKARFMLRMVDALNHGLLPMMADREAPSVEMSCKTCHRGAPRPVLLADVLRAELDEAGPEAMAARYRRLRENEGTAGRWDFGEWETNVLAERLAAEGRLGDAVAVYELNLSSYPNSISIHLSLGELYERLDRPGDAVGAYERVLEIDDTNVRARDRLAELRGGTPPVSR